MSEVRRIKVNKSVTKNKLLDYGFRYKENGDYRLYVPVYKWLSLIHISEPTRPY